MEANNALNKLKEQAEINALKRVQYQFSTPDQLEQIEQHISRNEKTKNMIENQLKSAIQSHFISVNSCMDQLKDVNKNLFEVKNTIYSIQEEYKTISHLENTLGELRKEATKHKQLKSAKENVQNILNVQDLAKKANQYIEENKLLLAHKCLFDMEKCRNDILEELGNPSDKNHNIDDIKLVLEFFKKVKELQVTVHNNIFLTIKRMLEVSKFYPEQLVTALRIITREEALDEYWIKKKEETGFSPSDRPKRWLAECKETIHQLIETKLQGCRIEERDTNDKWFSNHLSAIYTRFSDDLEIVKKLCEPCFPPSFKIFDFYVENITAILSNYLSQLIDSNQLKDKEFFILISWLDDYKSERFIGNPKLNYDVSKLPDLLDDSHFKKAIEGHFEMTDRNLRTWFQNSLDKNFEEWMTNKQPTLIEGYYESNLSNDINSIFIQQLDFIQHVNDERFGKELLRLIVNQLSTFVELLKGKISDFKAYHSRQTTQSIDFLGRMVATSNDCIRLKSSILNIRDHYDTFMDKDEYGGPNDIYESLGNKTINVSEYCLDCIVEEMTKCLDEQYFKVLLSREWLTNEKIIDTILNTSRDYMEDLKYLRPKAQLTALVKWHNRIKVEYMKGFLQNLSIMTRVFRKCQFSDPGERKLFSSKCSKEISCLEEWFTNMGSTLPDRKYAFDFESLRLMNKIISADDVEFLYMDISALVKKCPNLTSDMLFGILSLRGDISKSDFKEKFEDCIKPEAQGTPNKNAKTPKDQRVDEAIVILKRELKLQ